MRYSIRDIVTIAKAYEERKQTEQEHIFKRGDVILTENNVKTVIQDIGFQVVFKGERE